MLIPMVHPAIAGHFPGNPVVPGVVLLDEVVEALKTHLGEPVCITDFPAVKFVSPLRPGEIFEINFTPKQAGLINFELRAGGRRIVSGGMHYKIAART